MVEGRLGSEETPGTELNPGTVSVAVTVYQDPISNDTIGGNPQYVGRSLVSDNDCVAVTPLSQRESWNWIYHPSSGDLVGVQHRGWPADPQGTTSN